MPWACKHMCICVCMYVCVYSVSMHIYTYIYTFIHRGTSPPTCPCGKSLPALLSCSRAVLALGQAGSWPASPAGVGDAPATAPRCLHWTRNTVPSPGQPEHAACPGVPWWGGGHRAAGRKASSTEREIAGFNHMNGANHPETLPNSIAYPLANPAFVWSPARAGEPPATPGSLHIPRGRDAAGCPANYIPLPLPAWVRP